MLPFFMTRIWIHSFVVKCVRFSRFIEPNFGCFLYAYVRVFADFGLIFGKFSSIFHYRLSGFSPTFLLNLLEYL